MSLCPYGANGNIFSHFKLLKLFQFLPAEGQLSRIPVCLLNTLPGEFFRKLDMNFFASHSSGLEDPDRHLCFPPDASQLQIAFDRNVQSVVRKTQCLFPLAHCYQQQIKKQDGLCQNQSLACSCSEGFLAEADEKAGEIGSAGNVACCRPPFVTTAILLQINESSMIENGLGISGNASATKC